MKSESEVVRVRVRVRVRVSRIRGQTSGLICVYLRRYLIAILEALTGAINNVEVARATQDRGTAQPLSSSLTRK